MYFRSADEQDQLNYVAVCPYLQNLYRQYPPTPFPGGIGPGGIGVPQIPGMPGGFPQYPGGFPQYPGGFPQYPGGFPQFPGGIAGGPQGFGPPVGPPPSIVPTKAEIGIMAVSPRTIRRCLYRYTYIWLDNGRSFWAYLIYADRRSVAGWRWNGRLWVYFGVDIRRIDSFECY